MYMYIHIQFTELLQIIVILIIIFTIPLSINKKLLRDLILISLS